ncbi:MAG: protein-methionine-sulfoxide reductase catalytic subunit MsrP [Candidatus Rokuibacteriota bacterium]|nr:MAG: protein-methionine-sulfoxide reductase catalytic subunit MsrP [Candidatus Rokubacteria bacterium]
MWIRRPDDIKSSEITDEKLYIDRRRFLLTAGILGASGAGLLACNNEAQGSSGSAEVDGGFAQQPEDKLNTYEQITSYNNFYEFGTDKEDPKHNSAGFHPQPWSVRVEGLCTRPGDYHFQDLIKPHKVVDRTYRLRCVEAWSMVIPWDGFPLADFLKKHEPTSRAKYVAFETVVQPSMPGVKGYAGIPFPYLEGLRIDEAMHPLAILAVGLYGEQLPNQDGAPIRLVVPWKYGFKSAKSIVKIRLQETQPPTTWSQYAGGVEYGFYANVNPDVDHPRWSQATERRIGEFRRRKTLMLNGYADQVASLYTGMDLRKNY